MPTTVWPSAASASDSSAYPQPASSTSLRILPSRISAANSGCGSPMFHGGGPSKAPSPLYAPSQSITSEVMNPNLLAARSQVWTGSLLCIRSQYSRSISASACGRVMPRSCSACTVATCQVAPLRPVLARPSMTPRYRSRTSAATPQRRRPSSAIGSSWRSTSSSGVTSPRPGQYSRASIPCSCGLKEIVLVPQRNSSSSRVGRSSSDSVRSMP